MIRSIGFGAQGAVYLVGSTASEDLPVAKGAIQTGYRGTGGIFPVKPAPE